MSLLLDLIFPRTCYSCGRLGQYICPYCQRKIKPGQVDFHHSRHIEAHLAIFANQVHIKQPIYQLKYKFVTDLADCLTKLCLRHLKRNFSGIVDYWQQFNFSMTPVPIHLGKLNWRGFNQSQLLAQSIASGLSLNYIPDLLVKTKATLPQAQTQTKSHRLKAQTNSFSLNAKHTHLPDNIIVFDDIFTTGATGLSAAKTFKQNKQIWILSLI